MPRKKADALGDWVADHFGIDGFDSFEKLSEEERVFVAVWELYAAVTDGGFPSYYFNSGADHSDVVYEACRAIGVREVGELARKANSVFPNCQPATDFYERQKQYEKLTDDVDHDPWPSELDDQFFKLEDDLLAKLYDYVSAHRTTVRRADKLAAVDADAPHDAA